MLQSVGPGTGFVDGIRIIKYKKLSAANSELEKESRIAQTAKTASQA